MPLPCVRFAGGARVRVVKPDLKINLMAWRSRSRAAASCGDQTLGDGGGAHLVRIQAAAVVLEEQFEALIRHRS